MMNFARLGDTGTDEYWTLITSELLHHRFHTVSESDHDARTENAIEEGNEGSDRNRLLLALAVQPEFAETHASHFLNLLNANLLIGKMKDVGSTMSGNWRNILDKPLFMHANSVSNGLAFLKSASRLAVSMILFGNTPVVGAVRVMAPEAAEPRSLQTGDFEKWSNFWFGMVNCIGVLAAIVTLIKSFNCKKNHSIAGTSAASAPAGAIMDRAVNKAQTFTVLRAWHKTKYCELLVARCEEEGAYAP